MSNVKRVLSLLLLTMMFVCSIPAAVQACLPTDDGMGASPALNVVDELPGGG